MKKIAYFLIGWLAFAASAQAVLLVSIAVEKQQEIITLAVPDVSPHKVFTVEDPERLVVDVPALRVRPSVALPASYKGKLIKALRFGQFDPQTSRFVFEVTKPVRVVDVREENEGLVITTAAEGAPEEKESKPAKTEKSKKTAIKKPQKPLIVIDPGHGGNDPGTSGPDGTNEKDIVLLYAKTLRAKLLKTGHFRVKLTREDDRFIILRERVAIARKAGADVFVSLHADSATDMAARGLSVYTVSEKASDEEAEALAARENKADVLSGMDLSNEQPDVADILISLAERETKNRSAMLADFLTTSLDDKVQLLPNSHRFAGFAVLKAPDVPSVLIELGFLSHPREEKLLTSKLYREKVASGITAGIEAYFRQENK